MSINLSRVHSTIEWQRKNAILSEMGSNYRLRLTSQSPVIQIRGIRPFEDGVQQKTTGIRVTDTNSVERAFKLCLQLDEQPDALAIAKKQVSNPGYTAWSAFALHAEKYLREEKRIQANHPDYWRHLNELALLKGSVSPERVQAWLEAAENSSRERTRRLVTVRRLIEIGLEINPNWLLRVSSRNAFSGEKVVEPRDIPSDSAIENFVDGLINPEWRAAFAFIATWGLRNHEVFRLHSFPDSDGLLEISDNSKTGFRPIAPAHKEWIDRWNLRDVCLPDFNPSQTHKQLGNKVTTYFARYRHLATWHKASAYDLRHAWAARIHTHHLYDRIDTDLAAKMMGHDLKVHRRTYLRWTKKEELKQALRRSLVG